MKYFILILISLCIFDLYGQSGGGEFDYANSVELYSVEFIDNASNLFPVFPDDGVAEYPKPHFLASRTEQHPAAFLRGTVPYLKVRMKLNCHPDMLPNAEVYIKGVYNGQSTYILNINPHSDLANIISENGDYFVEFQTTSPTQVSATIGGSQLFTFPDAIHYGKIILDWRCYLKVDGAFIRINPANQLSTHQVYITNASQYGKPLVETTLAGFAPFHSLYDISCKAAIGADFRTEIISKVWNHIKSLHVTNKDGILLTYYKYCTIYPKASTTTIVKEVNTTAKLLRYYDGTCYAWADFFVDLLRVHGIKQLDGQNLTVHNDSNHEGNTVKVIVADGNDCGFEGDNSEDYFYKWFVVRNQNPQIPSGQECDNIACNGESPFRYVDKIPRQENGKSKLGGVSCNTVTGEYSFLIASTISQINVIPGNPVQGHSGLAGHYFGNHGIVLIDGKYYDPSYGIGPFNDYSSTEPGDYMEDFGGWGYEYESTEETEFGQGVDVDGNISNNEEPGIFFRFSKQNESTWKFKNWFEN